MTGSSISRRGTAEVTDSMAHYQRSDSFVYRSTLGEHLLVQLDSTKTEPMFALTETGARLWRELASWKTVGDLSETMVSEFDVSQEQAAADCAEFLEHLASIGALNRRGED